MKHLLLMVLLFVVFVPGLGLTPIGSQTKTPNLSGTWGLQYMGSEAPIKMTFVFKQEGEKLSGKFSGVGPNPPGPVTGSVKGNKVVFGWEMAGNGGTTQTVAFKGTIESATKMTGTVGAPFCGSEGCEWTGVKKMWADFQPQVANGWRKKRGNGRRPPPPGALLCATAGVVMHIRQLRGYVARFFGLFDRGRREREFAEELESHLALHIEDNLRAGMSPEEARRQARIKLGGVTWTQELHRE